MTRLKPPATNSGEKYAYLHGAEDMLRLLCRDLADYRDADEEFALILRRLEEELKFGGTPG